MNRSTPNIFAVQSAINAYGIWYAIWFYGWREAWTIWVATRMNKFDRRASAHI
jgi:hypothetical protein